MNVAAGTQHARTALFTVLPTLLPSALQEEVWAACQRPQWRFGNSSVEGGGVAFWKMDLEDTAALGAMWQHVRGLCEGLTAAPLRIVRVYANGHTFGQGGQPHADDIAAGTYTLLYYPMPEWRMEWEGETMFYAANGEILHAVRPQPNRAVLFDSRIPHSARPPSRLFGGLRVTVAFKLAAT